jgi:hypothetical protein
MIADFEKDIRELHHIFALAKEGSDNEVNINVAKREGKDTTDLEILERKINEKIAPWDPHCTVIKDYLTELHFIRNNIRVYFKLVQDKSNIPRAIDANEQLNELNERYKLKDEELYLSFSKVRNIQIDDNIKQVILKSILDGGSINVILDVVKHYFLHKSGKMSANDCIKHGINYVESDGKYPKGLFNGMLSGK